jgi:hypothetical protein
MRTLTLSFYTLDTLIPIMLVISANVRRTNNSNLHTVLVFV